MALTRRHGLLALGAVGAGLLSRPAIVHAQLRTLADTMAGDTRFSTFLDLITRNTQVEDFRQPGPLTVFAPVDQAWSGAPAGIMQDLLGRNEPGTNRNQIERDRVAALINYHLVPGLFTGTELTGADRRLRTLNGGDVQISSSGGNLVLQNPAPATQLGAVGAAGAQVSARPARVVGQPISASNGVIYPIDQVLFP
jgi:uncharacterized surface protein with fasciclin (FAS1) repeats